MQTKFICPNCKKEKEKHAKGLCNVCYKKLVWKPELVKCKRCERMLPMQAKGLCAGCYNSVFHVEKTRAANYRKWYGLDIETYKRITKKCVLCDFDKIVSLHHLDRDKINNSETNLIGLCPNHHAMIHHRNFSDEVLTALRGKGFNVSKYFKPDSEFKN